jgi:hypothetical protein
MNVNYSEPVSPHVRLTAFNSKRVSPENSSAGSPDMLFTRRPINQTMIQRANLISTIGARQIVNKKTTNPNKK